MQILDEDEDAVVIEPPFAQDMHDFFEKFCADEANMELLYAIIRQHSGIPHRFRILHLFYRTRPEGAETGNFLQEVQLTDKLFVSRYIGTINQEPSPSRTKILRIVLNPENTLYVELMNHFPLPVHYLTIPHPFVKELTL